MTDKQKEQIKQMRMQGLGYKRIANEVGLSRDSVRGYCRRNGLDGLGQELAQQHTMLMQEEFLNVLCLQFNLLILWQRVQVTRFKAS